MFLRYHQSKMDVMSKYQMHQITEANSYECDATYPPPPHGNKYNSDSEFASEKCSGRYCLSGLLCM